MKWISNQNIPRRSTAQATLHRHRLSGSSYHRTKQESSSNTGVRRVGSFDLIHVDMNPEMGVLLQLVPPGDSMDMGKGYDDDNWLH